MGDLISRSKLISHLNDWALQESPFRDMAHCWKYNTIQECIKAVEEQPEVQENSSEHGQWIAGTGYYTCSQCKEIFSSELPYIQGVYGLPNYCPECGAKMDK